MGELDVLKPKKGGPKSKKPTVSEFCMLRQSMTNSQLANHYKVTISTISRWTREFRQEIEKGV